ncbi:hypothetical protein [Evansella tamaricis]|uniref:Uncharacterized protein n=1 Tax=Evansella tamaricis TaxID=2069301 RepID=A0ABS6JJI3_9BACI|nr:hypothetical protein [Evansella tamaricis]MBU9713550.1 hypothetical protein [Evansella tamaricis]
MKEIEGGVNEPGSISLGSIRARRSIKEIEGVVNEPGSIEPRTNPTTQGSINPQPLDHFNSKYHYIKEAILLPIKYRSSSPLSK